MTLIYLWRNRERPSPLGKRWFKVWAKRVFNLPELLNITFRRLRYKFKGATVGKLVAFGRIDLHGSAKRLTVGERSFIGSNVNLALHEQIVIGNRVVINNNVQLLTGSHDTQDSAWQMIAMPIVIKDYAWVAYNAIILPGVTIGKGAVVGAGAVVSRDVPDYAVVVGSPAKIMGQRNRELSYSPVDLCSPFEAWLGKPTKQRNSLTIENRSVRDETC